jgi:hypothetical protein
MRYGSKINCCILVLVLIVAAGMLSPENVAAAEKKSREVGCS